MTNAIALANPTPSSQQSNTINNSMVAQNSPNVAVASTNIAANNRLQFNRLATERKTVHVMNANINKDITKRDRQILASYNQSGGPNGPNSQQTNTNLTNQAQLHNYQNQHYLNNTASAIQGGNTLDYNMTTGRSHTNAGSFLQKLSSKFSRR
jgi:hypothetical protein